jgi:prolyl oligopeptidase
MKRSAQTEPKTKQGNSCVNAELVGDGLTRRDCIVGALAAAGLLGPFADALSSSDGAGGSASTLKYPRTRRVAAVDGRAGVEFPDPYRWLEESSDEVRRWQQAQADLASSYIEQWPHFAALEKSVEYYSLDESRGVPRFAADKWFTLRGAQLVVSDTAFGAGRAIFDAQREKSEKPGTQAVVSWLAPSPDGRIVALGVCADGSEHNTIRLVRVDTGALLPNPPAQLLMDSVTGGVGWLPDSSGFFFEGLVGPAASFKRHMFYHDIASGTQTAVKLPAVDPEARDYTLINASRDGRYLVANHRLLTPIPVAIKDLSKPGSAWRAFVTGIKGAVAGWIMGDRYVAFTNVGARRGRVVAIPLDSPTPNDPQTWTDLVPESHAVIRSVALVGDHLYINELVDTHARVRILDSSGKLAEAPLPGKGAVSLAPFTLMTLVPQGHPDQFIFAFSSLTSSMGIYSHQPSRRAADVLSAPKIVLKDAVIEDFWTTSADGTKIPYHAVRLKNVDVSKPQPTLLHAYGGFGIPLLPGFPGSSAAFVAAGGVFVIANIRGGGEFGEDWWDGGRLKNKQNCYQDVYAVAEQMIRARRTKPDLLAVMGASNGGLLAGVVATQQPDLWKACLALSPLLDLIGALRDSYAIHFIRMEFADPDDAAEVRRLAGFSPYHMVKNGVKYPAVYIDAGDTDPRCPPWHARKFAARLQSASAGDAPILLHVWKDAGHNGWATDKSIQLARDTGWLAFTMQQLGMKL